VRGEADLRHPLTSSLALVELAGARVAAAQLRAEAQQQAAAAGGGGGGSSGNGGASGSAGSSMPAAAAAARAAEPAGSAEDEMHVQTAAAAAAGRGGPQSSATAQQVASNSDTSQTGTGAAAVAPSGAVGSWTTLQVPSPAAEEEVLLQVAADRSAWTGVQLVEPLQPEVEVFVRGAPWGPGHPRHLKVRAVGRSSLAMATKIHEAGCRGCWACNAMESPLQAASSCMDLPSC
jgi:hypothetical protein